MKKMEHAASVEAAFDDSSSLSTSPSPSPSLQEKLEKAKRQAYDARVAAAV